MTEQEHALLQTIKSTVKSNPEFFGMAVMYMNAGVKEAIREANEHAMNMEKLAFAFHTANSKKHTKETKAWVDRMIVSVQKDMKYFPIE